MADVKDDKYPCLGTKCDIPWMGMMSSKFFRKAVAVMGLLAVLSGLFGCQKAPKPAQHTISEISAVSIACAHMDYSYGYYFQIHREQEKWLFDTRCFTHEYDRETVFENRDVSDEDMETLIEILEKNDSITYAENYQKPKNSPFEVLDETTYSFCLTFLDGSQYTTRDWQKELEEFFYRLAEKYGNTENTDH